MKPTIQLAPRDRCWIPPDGLDHSAPRLTRLTPQGKVLVAFSVLLVLIGLATGLGLGVALSREHAESLLLSREGMETVATVLRVSRLRNESNQRLVYYRFEADGRMYEGQGKVPARLQLGSGSTLSVIYARGNPALNYASALGRNSVPAWLPFPASLLISACGLLILLPLRLQRRMLSEGRAAEAIVARHGKVQKGSHGRELGTQYFYEFRLLSGAVASGKAVARIAPAIGSRMTILYDREKPARNAPYPLQFVRLGY
jgi:hypothetical protein